MEVRGGAGWGGGKGEGLDRVEVGGWGGSKGRGDIGGGGKERGSMGWR